MPELRRNPLDGTWTVVSPERAARPNTFRAGPERGVAERAGDGAATERCPFCPGNESDTPPEVARTGAGRPDAPGWRNRVVPNLYPIVEGTPGHIQATGSRFHDAARATGRHEVAVMSPDHGRSLADLSNVEIEELFDVLLERLRVHVRSGHAYVQLLVNHGRAAGASVEHPHVQIVAIDLLPPAVVAEAEVVGDELECPVCRAVNEDADRGAPLVVSAGGPAPIWCPWWSSVPFEVMVAPRAHEPRAEHSGSAGDVARALGTATSLLRRSLGDVAYNLVVHTSPFADGADFHWHAHLWPRTTIPAGFEQGTGVMVNPLPPEEAAATLRTAGSRA